jgi:hypothetical protein
MTTELPYSCGSWLVEHKLIYQEKQYIFLYPLQQQRFDKKWAHLGVFHFFLFIFLFIQMLNQ